MKSREFKGKGFSLIEALVAILILSLGLLGVAAMQASAMKSAHVAYQRSIATVAAQDMVERLWIALGNGAPASIVCPDPTGTILDDWHTEWVEFIPSLVKSGAVQPGAPSGKGICEYTVTVSWSDDRFQKVINGAKVDEDVSRLVYVAKLIGEES